MNDTSEKNKMVDRENFFTQFSGDEEAKMKEIWDLSGQARPSAPDITDDEIDRALIDMKNRIGGQKGSLVKWRWFMAAAVLLLVLGAGILFVPQTVTAPRGEIIKTTLPDGSTIELNSGSEIQYNYLFSFTNRRIHLEGEAFFSVRRGEHPFIVEANGSAVKVTGTQFNVRSWNEEPIKETEVAVAGGTVQFYPLDRPEKFVTIRKGELSRWTKMLDKPTSPESVSVKKSIGWRQHKLMFNEKSMLVIFKELERRFDITIQLEAKSFADETLTAFYNDPENAATVLEDICRVKGLRYARIADGYRVYK